MFSVDNKANKMLGLLKRTCPLIEHSKIRQSLYHTFVKSQLCYATEVWSPATAKLQMILERVQRRATRWILKTNVGEMPYEDRLTTLNQLPLVYDRELRDLVLVYKSVFSCIDLNIEQFVSFVQHSHSRSQNPSLVLKPSYCKTSTFQASFFNRVVKPWNFVCKIASTDKFASLSIFKRFLHATYSNLVKDTFNVDMPCTWSLTCDCSCHRS